MSIFVTRDISLSDQMETVKVKEEPDMRMKPSTVITSDQHRHRGRGE